LSHPLLAGLRDPDPAARAQACRSVPDDPSAVLLLEGLAAALGDPDRSVARAASDSLVSLSKDRDDARPEIQDVLRRLLHGEDRRARFGAAYTRSRLGPPEPALLPALIEGFSSTDPDVRWSAARILVDLGRVHSEALGVALGLARSDPDPTVQRMAVFCLRELAPQEPAVAAALLDISCAKDLELRRAALASMAALRDPGAGVLARLEEALEHDPDPAARRLAAIALGELADDSAEPTASTRAALERACDSPDPHLRRAAERALARDETRD
jgi:HEAT repeat protein